MPVSDRRENMTLPELLDELELAFPEEVAGFERRHPQAIEAVIEDGVTSPDDTEDDDLAAALEDLAEDLRARLRI